MRKKIQLLVEIFPLTDSKVKWDVLYKESKNQQVSFREFKEDMTRYLKKKVLRFRLTGDHVVIEKYVTAEINELIKYFKIGTDIKEISLDTLYNSWRNPYNTAKNVFINKLERHLISKNISYFIFGNSLFIKEY